MLINKPNHHTVTYTLHMAEMCMNVALLRSCFTFTLGLALGLLVAMFIVLTSDSLTSLNINYPIKSSAKYESKRKYLESKFDFKSSFASELLKGAEEANARELARQVRILCWVLTTKENHETKAKHVKSTWGRHCNILLFISDYEDNELPAVKVTSDSNGREALWSKTVEAFKYVYHNYNDNYDWVIKADDDTYVIVENLREMLFPYFPNKSYYFGCHFKPYIPQGYMSGGAGYVLSKESVNKLVNEAFDGKSKSCPLVADTEPEDVNLGLCLAAIDIKPSDSRDSQGRHRFLPLFVTSYVGPPEKANAVPWFYEFIYWPMEGDNVSRASNTPVSFHYVKPVEMYMLEYLIYYVRPMSVTHLTPASTPQSTTKN